MEAKEITFTKPGALIGRTKYLRLEDDIYFVSPAGQTSLRVLDDVVRAIVDKEGLLHDTVRFFLVQTRVAYPSFSPGHFQALSMLTRFTDDGVFVFCLRQALCPEEVHEAFREEIGEAAQEAHP